MALKVSNRGKTPPFIVMDIMDAANERKRLGHDVIHLEVGQPGTSAPPAVIEAAVKALNSSRLGYTLAFGLQELRERISVHYKDFYSCNIDPRRIAITSGSSGAFILAFLSAFDPGDRVAMAIPSYPAYRNILNALGVEVLNIETTSETNFQPTVELLKKTSRDKGGVDGLIIASPSNPTGTMLSKNELRDIVDYCSEHGIRLISDEIYHGITFTMSEETAIKYSDDVIIINSFSKYFSMTGWRLGWMVMPNSLVRSVECLAQNLFISPPTLSQFGALAAFSCERDLQLNINAYKKNRNILLRELPKAGFSDIARSDGAFYLYANVRNLTHSSTDFCNKLLEETSVAATPGVDFDPIRGHSYVRFSFSGPTSDISIAAERLKSWQKS